MLGTVQLKKVHLYPYFLEDINTEYLQSLQQAWLWTVPGKPGRMVTVQMGVPVADFGVIWFLKNRELELLLDLAEDSFLTNEQWYVLNLSFTDL